MRMEPHAAALRAREQARVCSMASFTGEETQALQPTAQGDSKGSRARIWAQIGLTPTSCSLMGDYNLVVRS